MTTDEIVEKAAEYKHGGYNCAQSVVKALAEAAELKEDDLEQVTGGKWEPPSCPRNYSTPGQVCFQPDPCPYARKTERPNEYICENGLGSFRAPGPISSPF